MFEISRLKEKIMSIRFIFFLALAMVINLVSLATAHEFTTGMCEEGLELVLKKSTSEVSCVTPETANAIVERGWGTIVEETAPIMSNSDAFESFPKTPIYVPSEQGNQVSIGAGLDSIVKVTSPETGGTFAVLEDIAQPGSGPPRHIHNNQVEIFRFIEGEFEVLVGDDLLQASAGDIAVVPPGVTHTFSNVGDSPGRLFFIILPGDNFESFFYQLGENLQAENPPSPEAMNELFDKYNMELVGPPLSEE